MKRILSLILTLAMLLSLSGVLAVSASAAAASTPIYDPTFNNNAGAFFANGTPITISEDTGNTVISWNGGTRMVTATVTVFGGGEAGSSFDSASITMNGGTVSFIYGGGFSNNEAFPASVTSATLVINGGTVTNSVYGGGVLYSTVNTASVTVNGGTVGTVVGGGAASANLNGIDYSVGTEEHPELSPCAVETATVTINDGTIYRNDPCGLVFGGGQGYSRVTSATVIINGGDLSGAYVTAGGSNGYTGTAKLDVTGGRVNVVQGVNCGIVGSLQMTVIGGTVNTCYVGGETTDPTVSGKISMANFLAYQSAQITSLQLGKSDNKAYDASTNNFIDSISFRFSPSCVTNYDDIKDYGTTVWTVTFDMNGHGSTPKVYTAVENDTAIMLFPNVPSESGLTFDGWYDNPAFTGAKITRGTYTVTSDVTLFAKWTSGGSYGPFSPYGPSGPNGPFGPESSFTVDSDVISSTTPTTEVEEEAEEETASPCVDVSADDYYYDAVLWAYENGICNGVDATHFDPTAPVDRAQVVTFLWRAAGKPVVDYFMQMDDVKSGEYYTEAVRWALAEGITKGIGASEFGTDEICTRGQIVTFLARFAGAADAVTESAFSDVPADEFFAAAAKWAADNGVTNGVTDTTFEPYTECNRAQVVTFLYRWMVK